MFFRTFAQVANEKAEVKESAQASDNYDVTIIEHPVRNTDTLSTMQPTSEKEVFKVVAEMPRFPGCENSNRTIEKIESCAKEKLETYIYDNLVYPEEAITNGIEGTVVVEYIIDTSGQIIDVEIKNDIGAGCGEAAATVIESMNAMSQQWRPGHQRGRRVDVLLTQEVHFNLDDYE
jgi:protein TonB